MNRLFFCFACLFVITPACRNESRTANDAADRPENKVSILGIWKVQRYSDAMYSLDDHELLKGPFLEDGKGDTLRFTADSIYGSDQTYKSRDWYTYKKVNDSVLDVKNITSGNSMVFHIHYLGKDSLYFTNIRPERERVRGRDLLQKELRSCIK
jgi:hypothetical protein